MGHQSHSVIIEDSRSGETDLDNVDISMFIDGSNLGSSLYAPDSQSSDLMDYSTDYSLSATDFNSMISSENSYSSTNYAHDLMSNTSPSTTNYATSSSTNYAHDLMSNTSPSTTNYGTSSPTNYVTPSTTNYVTPSTTNYLTPTTNYATSSSTNYITPSTTNYATSSSTNYVTPSTTNYATSSSTNHVTPSTTNYATSSSTVTPSTTNYATSSTTNYATSSTIPSTNSLTNNKDSFPYLEKIERQIDQLFKRTNDYVTKEQTITKELFELRQEINQIKSSAASSIEEKKERLKQLCEERESKRNTIVQLKKYIDNLENLKPTSTLSRNTSTSKPGNSSDMATHKFPGVVSLPYGGQASNAVFIHSALVMLEQKFCISSEMIEKIFYESKTVEQSSDLNFTYALNSIYQESLEIIESDSLASSDPNDMNLNEDKGPFLTVFNYLQQYFDAYKKSTIVLIRNAQGDFKVTVCFKYPDEFCVFSAFSGQASLVNISGKRLLVEYLTPIFPPSMVYFWVLIGKNKENPKPVVSTPSPTLATKPAPSTDQQKDNFNFSTKSQIKNLKIQWPGSQINGKTLIFDEDVTADFVAKKLEPYKSNPQKKLRMVAPGKILKPEDVLGDCLSKLQTLIVIQISELS